MIKTFTFVLSQNRNKTPYPNSVYPGLKPFGAHLDVMASLITTHFPPHRKSVCWFSPRTAVPLLKHQSTHRPSLKPTPLVASQFSTTGKHRAYQRVSYRARQNTRRETYQHSRSQLTITHDIPDAVALEYTRDLKSCLNSAFTDISLPIEFNSTYLNVGHA